jgi:hypothetical protein
LLKGLQRRWFPDHYKRQSVDIVAWSGCSVEPVTKELWLAYSVLRG